MVNLADALVVSDSDALTGLVRFALGRYWGVQIRHAATREEASTLIAERSPQLLVVDVDASAFDGFALLRDMAGRGMRLVAVNDRVAGPASVSAMSGAQATADMPFTPAKLHTAIESAWAVPV